MKALGGGLLALFLVPCAVAGTNGPIEGVAALVRTCIELQNDFERLACYDKAAEQLDDAEGTLDSVSPEDVFGMVKGAEPKPQARPREQLNSITAIVSNIRDAADGRRVIELDNGQTWRQVDTKQLRLDTGERITISRGALSSFKLSTSRGQLVRVQRVL